MAKHSDKVTGTVHAINTVASFVPALGKVADGLDATISAAEGNYGEAALTAGGGKAAQLLGKAVKVTAASVLAAKVVSHLDEAADVVKIAANSTHEVVDVIKTARKVAGEAALDANALIRGIEKGESTAVDTALAGRNAVVSRQAVREFLVKGDKKELRQFLKARGGRVGQSGSQAEVSALQQTAQSLGRRLKPKDARVGASAAKEGVPLITRDESFRNFLNEVGIGGESF